MTNLMTVFDIQKQSGRPFKTRHTGLLGVEIETETVKKYEWPVMKFWDCKKDGSLRDYGVEYVLKAPVNVPELETALVEFELADKKFGFRKESISTSVHVHVNMLNQPYRVVANFITAWTVVEGLMVKYSGPDRLSNLFCLPVTDAEGLADHWEKFLLAINRNMFKNASLSSDAVKYGALNVATMSPGSLGTLEVRCFRGETDIKNILKWVDLLEKLKNFSARGDITPPKILEMYDKLGPRMIDLIFLEAAKELKCKDWEKLITPDHVKIASKFACVSKDWDRFGILKMKPVYKEMIKGKLEEISQDKFQRPFDELGYHERSMVYEVYHRLNPSNRILDLKEDV